MWSSKITFFYPTFVVLRTYFMLPVKKYTLSKQNVLLFKLWIVKDIKVSKNLGKKSMTQSAAKFIYF